MFAIVLLIFVVTNAAVCNHVFGPWITTTAPTCQSEGKQERRCTNSGCGQHEYRKLAKVPHDFSPATCTAPSKCRFCKLAQGSPLGHAYSSATCIYPEKCSRCGVTRGGLGSHRFSPATCIKLATCSVCHITTGSFGPHQFSPHTGRCVVCGRKNDLINSLPIPVK